MAKRGLRWDAIPLPRQSVLLGDAGVTVETHAAVIDTEPLEVDIQAACVRLLQLHPAVAWAHRMNTGAGRFVYPDGKQSRFLRFGFPGQADILGQLRRSHGGRFLAVEVKRPGEKPTDDQLAFLEAVRYAGGVAILAYSCDDVARELRAL